MTLLQQFSFLVPFPFELVITPGDTKPRRIGCKLNGHAINRCFKIIRVIGKYRIYCGYFSKPFNTGEHPAYYLVHDTTSNEFGIIDFFQWELYKLENPKITPDIATSLEEVFKM